MNMQRILYPYVRLTQITGDSFDILADLIGCMTVRQATGELEDGTKKEFKLTEIITPFGAKYQVIETPDQIAAGIEKATNNSIKNTQQAMARGLVLAKGLQ